MRTETKTVTYYTINELSESAKERARDWWMQDMDYAWNDEWMDSMQAFCKVFPIKAKDYQIGAFCSAYVRADFTSDLDLSGVRLFKYIQNNFGHLLGGDCPLTGYCGDESLFDPIRAFMKRPSKNVSFSDLLTECLDNWAEDFKSDMESQHDPEYVDDHLETNGYEFLEDGTRA